MKNLIISGPTASGKSGIAIRLAERLGNAEIISADAFQVYKGLDIGTAKATRAERDKILHHLIDIQRPEEVYTAGLFACHAERLIDEIRGRGNIPIIVGGTGLYIKSITDGMFYCPEIDPNIRALLQSRIKTEGLNCLYEELKKCDPEYALRISPNDPVRIVRALEVCVGLKVSFTEAHKIYKKVPAHKYCVMLLAPDRETLYADINKRTETMWRSGWLKEVKGLLEKGVPDDCPAFRAIGYGEIVAYVKNGGDQSEVIREIAKQTRHFAKRQFTWFRGMSGVRFYGSAETLFQDAEDFCLSGGVE